MDRAGKIRRTTKPRKSSAGRAEEGSYDQLKVFEGKVYSGMKVGRKHTWRYEEGQWHETKVSPDEWDFSFSVPKHRKGHAPEGSGAPVGTAYHWFIVAHQIVTKIDANTYTTEMAGAKHKLAHRRADRETWSASERAQRKHLAKILRQMLEEIESSEAEVSEANEARKRLAA